MPSSVSVKRIAQLANVSPATVSRVLNATAGVSEDKAARVREAIRQIGGAPRRRPLRNKGGNGSRRIALLLIEPDGLHTVSVELYQTILHVERFLRESGAVMVFGVLKEEARLPQPLLAAQLDGVLLAGKALPPEIASALEEMPSVWLTSHHEGKHEVSLAGNEEIGRLAAQYFLDGGHRSLAYLRIPEDHPSHPSRMEFFEYLAAKAGAEVHILSAPLGQMNGAELRCWDEMSESVAAQVGALAALRPRPTALFVPVGMLTGLVYRALAAHGLKAGRDVEVVCCEANYPMATGLEPRPGVISVNTETIARRAVMELFHRLEHRRSPSTERGTVRLLIEPTLHPGEHSGRKDKNS